MLLVGAVLTLALFFLPIPTKGNVEQLSYSQLKSDISDGQVASVALGPSTRRSAKLLREAEERSLAIVSDH